MPVLDSVIDPSMTVPHRSPPVARAEPSKVRAARTIPAGEASPWLTPILLGGAACGGLYALVPQLPAGVWAQEWLASRSMLQWAMLLLAFVGMASAAVQLWRGRRQHHAAGAAQVAIRTWSLSDPADTQRELDALASRVGAGSWAVQRLTQVAEAIASGEPSARERARIATNARAQVEEAYQPARATASVLPVVGLAATVYMLSAGMASLAGFARVATDYGSLRTMLGGFGGALTGAFESTLLSLVLMLPVLLLAGIARARDEATLKDIDRLADRLAAIVPRARSDGPDAAFVEAAAARIVGAVELGLARLIETLRSSIENAMPKIDPDARRALEALPAVLTELTRTINSPPAVRLPEATEAALARVPQALEDVATALAEPRQVELSIIAQSKA